LSLVHVDLLSGRLPLYELGSFERLFYLKPKHGSPHFQFQNLER
jgi:hypothetical protein